MLDEQAALKACSWGLFQTLGENSMGAAFPSIEAFLLAMMIDRKDHLRAFAHLIAFDGRKEAMTSRSVGVACCLVLVACGRPDGEPRGRPAPAPVASLPLAATMVPSGPRASAPATGAAAFTERDGKPLTIRLAGGRTVRLQGFRRVERTDLSVAQCAVDLDGRRLATMGVGATAEYTCTGLVAAGAVPAKGGSPRVGIIYDVVSPNASFRAAVVLEEAGGAWRVDEDLAGEFDGGEAGRSIAGLRAALAKRDRTRF